MTEATLLLYTETTNLVLARFTAQVLSYAVTGHYSGSLRLPLVPELQAHLHAISVEEAAHICLLRSTRLRALSLTSRLVLKLLPHNDELACLHSQNFAKPLVSSLLREETHILHWHLQKARHAGSLHECVSFCSAQLWSRGVSELPPEEWPGQAVSRKTLTVVFLPGSHCWT